MMDNRVIDGCAMMLEAGGASSQTVEAVRMLVRDDGMVPIATAVRTLGVSRFTVRRMCERDGVRTVSRRGRQGNLVHLPSLMETAERKAAV